MTEQQELQVTDILRRAGLTAREVEIILRRAAGETIAEIARALGQPRPEIDRRWKAAQKKMQHLVEVAERTAKAFPALLIFCVLDRRTYDERPAGVQGVTPDRSSDRFQGAQQVAADDTRLQQDLASALRLAEEHLRPVQVE